MRRTALVGVVGVLAASGAYALIYLFRWEWHRAIITALFFVAAEVALGVVVILRRLARVEERLEQVGLAVGRGAGDIDPAVLARIREAAPPPRSPFGWLDPNDAKLGVFLPFLLGVGAVASGLAWGVEQMARRTTMPALEHRLAQRLAPLAVPSGGLLGAEPQVLTRSSHRARPLRFVLRVGAAGAIALVGASGIDWLGDSLQTRPDRREAGVSTRIEVQMRGARSAARPEQSAALLWATCSHTLHGTVGPAAVRHLGGGRMEVLVPAHIGSHAEQRVRGCLQDALVDRVQASVLTLETVPARSTPSPGIRTR